MASFERTEWSPENDKTGGGVKPVTPQKEENREAVAQVRAQEVASEEYLGLEALQAFMASSLTKVLKAENSTTPVSEKMDTDALKIEDALAEQKAATNTHKQEFLDAA